MTEETKNSLYEVISNELNGLTENVIANYQENMQNRDNNPFLLFEDPNAKKYMALGRSIDSQLGNRMQRIIFHIARLRYGTCHVPNILEINIKDQAARNIECVLYSIRCDLPIEEQNRDFNPYRQYVYINKNSTESQIKRALKIKAHSNSLEKRVFPFSGIPEERFATLVQPKNRRGKIVNKILVDLLFFDCPPDVLDHANAFEIKMGGNLDTKNAKSNAEEVKFLSNLLGFLANNSAYFATCYGECSHAVRGDVEDILGNNAICNNREFWNKIIPSCLFTYEDFISIYAEAFRATGLENRLHTL